MSMLPKPDRLEDAVLVTHQGCPDGSGCAIMFRGAGGKKENVRYVAAGMVERFIKSDPVFNTDKFLIFADVGLNLPKYADILEKRGNIVLLDHHNTSLHLAGRSWAEIEEKNERCGTVMLRDYLITNFPDEGRFIKSTSWRIFASILDDFDRWQNKIPDSERLVNLFAFLGQEDFVEKFIDPKARLGTPSHKLFYKHEEDLLVILERRRSEAIEQCIRKAIRQDLSLPDGSTVSVVYVISAETNVSIILQSMLDANPDSQVAIQLNVDKGSAHLRSRNSNPDVSAIAGMFGGGGHKSASGHRLPQGLSQYIIDEVYGG